MQKRKMMIVGGVLLTVAIAGAYALKVYPTHICKDAPPAHVAEKMFQDNQVFVENINKASPGFTVVSLDTTHCPDKGILRIGYDTSANRSKLEDALEQTPLKDMPVLWQNV